VKVNQARARVRSSRGGCSSLGVYGYSVTAQDYLEYEVTLNITALTVITGSTNNFVIVAPTVQQLRSRLVPLAVVNSDAQSFTLSET
jgi:hypothetical protein